MIIAMEKQNLALFEEIYKHWNPSLQKYSDYYVKDSEASRTIVNDLFVRLWFRKIKPDNLEAYLFRAVKNASLNYLETQKRSLLVYEDEEKLLSMSDLHVDNPVPSAVSEKLRFLEKVIDQLPERRRVVFRLHRLEGFSYAEIAELLQISTRTVEDHLAKSMQFIHAHAKHLVDQNLTET